MRTGQSPRSLWEAGSPSCGHASPSHSQAVGVHLLDAGKVPSSRSLSVLLCTSLWDLGKWLCREMTNDQWPETSVA